MSQAPCHSAEAQNSKQKKTIKNKTISFSSPIKQKHIRSIWSTMGFPGERERDHMYLYIYIYIYIFIYIYKSTYACYNVCPLTARARPKVYIQIDLCLLRCLSVDSVKAPCHSAETQIYKQKKTVKNMTISF